MFLFRRFRPIEEKERLKQAEKRLQRRLKREASKRVTGDEKRQNQVVVLKMFDLHNSFLVA